MYVQQALARLHLAVEEVGLPTCLAKTVAIKFKKREAGDRVMTRSVYQTHISHASVDSLIQVCCFPSSSFLSHLYGTPFGNDMERPVVK